ncbi:MAG: SLBB domain-containing protein [Acidobacteriota bacterium]|nr:SLBB domain-containing protein [Acidobacteriota bacterium]
MKFKVLLGFIVMFGLFQVVFGQEVSVTPEEQRGYLIGPGDEITGKVLGEEQFDFIATIDEDGKFQVPFFDKTIEARCRTEKEVRSEVTELLSKYLKNPQISVRVTQRKSRSPVIVTGEVRVPQQVELRREARLLELISFAGGETNDAGGMVQVFRTTPLICADPNQKDDWIAESNNGTDVPSRLYSLGNLRLGREEANPIIYPGDVIVVQKASPVYITGEVVAPQGIILKGGGTSLTEAIAKIGGVRREAKTKDIKIYRLKANSKDREIISVNYDRIKKGEQKDVMLEPYDIVEVDKSKKSIPQLILETALGVGRTAIGGIGNALPQRVLY